MRCVPVSGKKWAWPVRASRPVVEALSPLVRISPRQLGDADWVAVTDIRHGLPANVRAIWLKSSRLLSTLSSSARNAPWETEKLLNRLATSVRPSASQERCASRGELGWLLMKSGFLRREFANRVFAPRVFNTRQEKPIYRPHPSGLPATLSLAFSLCFKGHMKDRWLSCADC